MMRSGSLARNSFRSWWSSSKLLSPSAAHAQKHLPLLAAALRKSESASLSRGSLMRTWATVRLSDTILAKSAALLLQQSQLDCKAFAKWVEALVATSGRMTSETEVIWEALALKAVPLLKERVSPRWWLPFQGDCNCDLKDVAAIMSAFAVAAPEAEFSRRVCEGAACAAQAIAGGAAEYDIVAWRRLAWACSVVGEPRPDVFGFPEVAADSKISSIVWNSLKQKALADKMLESAPFPLLHMHKWLPNDVAHCLVEAADSGGFWESSPLAAPGSPEGSRTSSSAVLVGSRLSKTNARIVLQVQERAADLFGLPLSHMEPPQLVKYDHGEQYATHVDWGRREDSTLWLSGQRVASALVYLTDHPEGVGGETHFPQLSIAVKPTRGSVLAWPNVSIDGAPLQETEHEARPLKLIPSVEDSGEACPKVAVNLWAREWPLPGPW